MEKIYFNASKHHLQTIVEKINLCSKQKSSSCDKLLNECLKSGLRSDYNGIIDIYEGNLGINDIKMEIASLLEKYKISDIDSYRNFLETSGKIKRRGYYINYNLSDQSIFTLRLADDEQKFVHIHPARYSPNTFRIRANTLKTIILTRFLALCNNKEPHSLETINEARKKLELSPVCDKVAAIHTTLKKLNR